MRMTPSKIVLASTILLVLAHPPLTLGLFGPEGRRAGLIIDDALGTDQLRIAMFGRR